VLSSFWGCGKFLGVSDEKPSAANRQRNRGANRKELSAKSDGTKWKRSLAGLPWSKFREFRRGLLRRKRALIEPGRKAIALASSHPKRQLWRLFATFFGT
jgi:hypothetical protein